MMHVGFWTELAAGLIRIGALARRLFRSRRGSVAIMMGALLAVLVGMVALGTEITFVLYKQRQMQSAADTAALSAATALSKGYPADFTVEGRAISAASGFKDGDDGASVTVHTRPASGPHAGDASAVEVVIAQPQTLTLVGLSLPFNVSARAVAMKGAGGDCVLQLYGGNTTGVTISNGATVNLEQCGMGVDATGTASLSMSGGAVLNTLSVSASGGISVTNGAVIHATNGTKSNQPAVADPYASVALPTYSGCSYNNKSYGHSNSGMQYISPGVYCKGLAFTNDAMVTMNPGVYIIDRGSFNVGGAVQLTGTGVTIVLTKSTGSSYATITIGNGAQVTLTAPTSGALAGLVFFGDRNAPLSNSSNFGGGANFNITGSIYLPSQTVTFNNGISNPSGCTQLIAGKIQFSGGAQFKNNCDSAGARPIGGGTASQLVE